MRRLVTVSLAALAIGASLPEAMAYLKAGPNMAGPGHHRLKGISASTPPLDGLPTPSGAYSFRKLRTGYGGSAVRIRRASDNAELDIAFLGCTTFTGCPWDEAAAAAHCAATTCFLRTRYDQSGNARDFVMATAGNQPALIFNCNGSLPCLRTTTNTQSIITAANVTPATGIVSFSVVAKRSTGTGACTFIRENGVANRLGSTNASANNWQLQPSGVFATGVADGTFHAAIGVAHTTAGASLLNVDGTETVGTTVPTTAAGTAGITGGAATTCDQDEEIFWDNYVLTSLERSALLANQRGYWDTP